VGCSPPEGVDVTYPLGREVSAILAYLVWGSSALCSSRPDQHALLWLHACFFGLTWGACGPQITAKTADLFQGPHLGAILGVISIGTGLGAGGGAWTSGTHLRSLRQLPAGCGAARLAPVDAAARLQQAIGGIPAWPECICAGLTRGTTTAGYVIWKDLSARWEHGSVAMLFGRTGL
jgi:hypothetical protein